jgi:putative FmdB family regulatory protein
MPAYEYECRECHKNFQIVAPISEYNPKAVKCPKCGSKKVERLWSSVFVETSKKS